MEDPEQEDLRDNVCEASSFLKGLANENRLMILCTLAQGESNVSDLEKLLGVRQPTLSQQLARLRAEGLVATRRESKSIYYSLASEDARQLIELLYKQFCGPDAKGITSCTADDQV